MLLISGPEIARYGFPHGHPFGSDRHAAFMARLEQSPVAASLVRSSARQATREELEYFHTPAYVDRVIELSARGSGLLDAGDTPAFPGVYEAAANVVGGTLEALAAIVAGPTRRAFIPIGGLHHATRDSAAGFCVFNDCGVAIEAARRVYGIRRVAYVDIDAHHGDGVFYAFEQDPELHVRRPARGRPLPVSRHRQPQRDGARAGRRHEAQYPAAAGRRRRACSSMRGRRSSVISRPPSPS